MTQPEITKEDKLDPREIFFFLGAYHALSLVDECGIAEATRIIRDAELRIRAKKEKAKEDLNHDTSNSKLP